MIAFDEGYMLVLLFVMLSGLSLGGGLVRLVRKAVGQ